MFREEFDRIYRCPKSADFDQKAWAIAHGFEHGGFWSVLETVSNSIKRLPHAYKCNYKCLGDSSRRFGEHFEGSEISRF